MGRTLSEVLRRIEAPGLRGLAALALVVCCLTPLLSVGSDLLSAGAIAHVRVTLGQASAWTLLGRSLGLALATTVCALAVGVPMGVLLGRSDMLGRRAALWLHLFPVFVPPFLLALGWFHLLGRQGLIGTLSTSRALFGSMGVVAVLASAFAPVVSAFTALGVQGIDPSLEEAARVVSRPLRVVTHILVPLAWRSIAFSAIVVFALAISEIGVPMFLRVRTFPAAVFTRLGGIDYAPGEAAALALPLVAVGLALAAIDRRLLGRRSVAALGLRSRQAAPVQLGRARLTASLLVWLGVVISLLPIAALSFAAGPTGLVQAASWIRGSAAVSLQSGALAATVIVLMGVLLGHALARMRRGATALDTLALLAFMMPAAILGVGLIAVWNRPATQFIYSTSALLVLGLAARYAVLGIRIVSALFARSSRHYEEAAACAGGGFARRMTRIVVPMHARGLIGAWLIAFVFCLRDLDTVIVFYPPGLEPLIVRIFTLEANGPVPVVAGLAVYQVALTALTLLAGAVLLRRLPRGW